MGEEPRGMMRDKGDGTEGPCASDDLIAEMAMPLSLGVHRGEDLGMDGQQDEHQQANGRTRAKGRHRARLQTKEKN